MSKNNCSKLSKADCDGADLNECIFIKTKTGKNYCRRRSNKLSELIITMRKIGDKAVQGPRRGVQEPRRGVQGPEQAELREAMAALQVEYDSLKGKSKATLDERARLEEEFRVLREAYDNLLGRSGQQSQKLRNQNAEKATEIASLKEAMASVLSEHDALKGKSQATLEERARLEEEFRVLRETHDNLLGRSAQQSQKLTKQNASLKTALAAIPRQDKCSRNKIHEYKQIKNGIVEYNANNEYRMFDPIQANKGIDYKNHLMTEGVTDWAPYLEPPIFSITSKDRYRTGYYDPKDPDQEILCMTGEHKFLKQPGQVVQGGVVQKSAKKAAKKPAKIPTILLYNAWGNPTEGIIKAVLVPDIEKIYDHIFIFTKDHSTEQDWHRLTADMDFAHVIYVDTENDSALLGKAGWSAHQIPGDIVLIQSTDEVTNAAVLKIYKKKFTVEPNKIMNIGDLE